ncbi:MAG TPA: 50S ribosomal protein L18e [archaeon]|nr:50S ribosomal protein L18e [archaeon]
MPRPTGPTNPLLKSYIAELRQRGFKDNSKFLLNVADLLERPARIRAEVTLAKLNRVASEGESVVVPGKVLSGGVLEKKITVAAWSFSADARDKIKKAGGKALDIRDFISKNAKGTGARVVL